MYILKKLVIFLSLFFLTGCGASMMKYSKEEFAKNERGVVFFDVKEDGLSIPFIIASSGDKEVHSVEQSNGMIFYTEDKDLVKRMLFLEPGMYYISSITLLDRGNSKRWYPSPGVVNKVVQYGAFYVKAGEVLSLGILNIKDTKFLHEYNFLTLKYQLLKSDKAELVTKLKQGTFYERGSLVIKTKDNKRKIVSAAVVENQRKQLINEIIRRLEAKEK